MDERVCIRSGGCQPPVARGTAPARECHFCDARRTRTGAGGVSLPWFTVTHLQDWVSERLNAEVRCQPPVVHGNALARAWRNCSGNIRPTHWRAPAQSRYSHTHGGLTPAALVSGESLPACAWRFPLHARSRNHGGPRCGARDAVRSRWVVAVLCQRDCRKPAADRRALLVSQGSGPACALRFPLPARFLNPVPQTRYCVPQKSLFLPRPNGVHQGHGFRSTAQASSRTLKSRSSVSRWR